MESTSSWHERDVLEVLQALESGESGLDESEAAERLTKFGRNRLPEQKPPALWQIALRQFLSPLIYILIGAAVVSLAIGDLKDAGFIAAVLMLNAVIGSWQEWKAERSSQALRKLLQIHAVVQRGGEAVEVNAEEVVPGDIVWLESGNRVPADLRLVSAHGLEIDESLLTGESVPVTKDADWRGEATVADRLNIAHAGSIVIRGRGKGVVVATGTATMVGQLAIDVLGTSGGTPPLLERMQSFAQTIAYAVLAAVALVSVVGIVVHGYSLYEMFLFGVALAVSAIPEGLPAALTVALAIATIRMARRGVIVRRLAAVEGLGSCTMIASDKTGTLTCNELTVRRIWLPDRTELQVSGEGFAPLGQILLNGVAVRADENEALRALVNAAVLCNESDLHRRDGEWVWRGDPTDVALLAVGEKAGVQRETLLDEYPQAGDIPFEPEHRFAATFHELEASEVLVVVKGAPERVLNMCDWSGNESRLRETQAMAESLAEQGFRVLALADSRAPESTARDGGQQPPLGLAFRGFMGMIDPLRPGVRDAVASCQNAGITVCMITGDHPATALAISRDLGLASSPEQVLSGGELSQMNPAELRSAIRRGRVFARVAPRQKLQLVEAARAEGHFVAVTGDGVNDAPALRAANIGVAMGKSGTDVAREAAELVISDDNFATIVSGVEEGRIAYDNVRKVIYLLVSTGAAEVLLIAAAFAVGAWLPLPLLPVQLLWLNLVTNGIQGIALAFEPGEEGILRRKPRRPTEPIFNQLMMERTVVAAIVMAAVGVATFWWMVRAGWSDASARNALLLLLVLFENIHIGNCRSETQSALTLSPLKSPFLLAGAVGAFSVHFIAMHVPLLQSVLQTAPVNIATWLAMIALSLSIFVAMEIHKWTWWLRHRDE